MNKLIKVVFIIECIFFVELFYLFPLRGEVVYAQDYILAPAYNPPGNNCCQNPIPVLPGGQYEFIPDPGYNSPPPFPKNMQASWTFNSNNNHTYDVIFTWVDSNPTSYSLTMNKYSEADPGPDADTSGTSWKFINVTTGRWYINMKKMVDGQWSEINYWTINIPEWVAPTDTPTPIDAIASIQDTQKVSNFPQIILILVLLSLIVGTFIYIFPMQKSKGKKKYKDS